MTLTSPFITDALPLNTISWIIKFLFCLNLIFSYCLQIYPVYLLSENYFFNEKSNERNQNLARFCFVLFTICVILILGDKADKFVSLAGALTCTPIAFTFPAVFYLVKCAETRVEIIKAKFIIGLSLIVFVLCTYKVLQNW